MDLYINLWKLIYFVPHDVNSNVDSDGHEDILYDSYCESKYFPCSSIKIGGTPQSTQDNKTVENYDLIQLTDSKFLPHQCLIAATSLITIR